MSKITVRPVYDRRFRRGYAFGIYAGDVLTALATRYPSQILREVA